MDKQILNQVIDIAEELMASEEFEAAIPKVQKAIQDSFDAAVAVADDKTAIQTEINDAWSNLLDKLQLLSFEKGDKTLLGELDVYKRQMQRIGKRSIPRTPALPSCRRPSCLKTPKRHAISASMLTGIPPTEPEKPTSIGLLSLCLKWKFGALVKNLIQANPVNSRPTARIWR